MNDKSQNTPRGKAGSASQDARRSAISSSFERFEKRQSELWRLTFLILFLLVLAYAWTSWGSIRTLTHHFEALPIGLVVLVALFSAYMWKKTREISELRGLLRGIEERDAQPPSDRQMDQLFEMISKSQQGYRDLIDSFDDLLLAVTLDGRIRAANRSFSDLVETPFQEIIGKPISEFVQEGSGQEEELLKRSMPRFLERRHWTGVLQVRLKNQKSPFYFDCVVHAMMRGENIHGITVLARDVSALRRNETRFTELFETLQEGIYITTPDGRILDVNPALVRMLGYESKDDLLKRQVPEILLDPAERKALMQQAETQPLVAGREITLLRKDGGSIVVLNTVAAVRDNAGKVVRYQGAVMDITERREIERRLRQQQEFARRLVDNFPDMILVLDTNSQYTFVSPRCREILGYEPAELAALGFGHYVHPEEMPTVRMLYDDIVAARRTYESLEVRVRRRQGDWRRILFNFSPLSDEKGSIEGVVLSGRDVTDIKRLEEQLIQAEKLAAMGQMLAGVAHELNNPLTAVLGVTELLRERAGLDESFARQLDLTHRQARRAARIVQNLLEFSRPASAQKKLLDVNNLIERTLQLHEHSLRRNSIEVDFRPDTSLPGIMGDANQLIQVFLNLVTNAEQAIREVRESGRLQIRPGRSGDRISITFQDDGVGIRPEALPRIFDPFYTTKRPGGGTGLGLSICMSIVREHGGLIEAEALPAGGSVFTVTLPPAPVEKSSSEKVDAPTAPLESAVSSSSAVDLRGAAPAGAPVPAAPGHGSMDSANAPSASAKSVGPHATTAMSSSAEILKGRSVLVLDDEESLRSLLQEGLSGQGLRVDCAATAEDALGLIRRLWESDRDSLDKDNGATGERSSDAVAPSPENGQLNGYDILLCDLHLSAGGYFVDGREATARLLEAIAAAGLAKPVVVYMTGDLTDPGPETPARGEPAFLQKPFRISEVLALFREGLAPAEPQPK
ncbi:MAG TPA: PAS domain S-box protein [Candidatus Acidoferrum sp.]|nr:PAS domain S-box protein [Candidatus Acidoferrum sp.]